MYADINMPIRNDSIGVKIKQKVVERNVDSSNSSQADADFGISKRKEGKKLARSIGN